MLPILRQLQATCYRLPIKCKVLTNASPNVTAAMLSAITTLIMLSFMYVPFDIFPGPVCIVRAGQAQQHDSQCQSFQPDHKWF